MTMIAYWRERSTLGLTLLAGIGLGVLMVLDFYRVI
jgi:hypothetical protein